jgi:hypothetical protein
MGVSVYYTILLSNFLYADLTKLSNAGILPAPASGQQDGDRL